MALINAVQQFSNIKKTIILLTLLTALTSCWKKRTCTCADSTGKVVSKKTQGTFSRSSTKQFEEDCEKTKVSESSLGGTIYTPCVISK